MEIHNPDNKYILCATQTIDSTKNRYIRNIEVFYLNSSNCHQL